jgi:hypothetical protein
MKSKVTGLDELMKVYDRMQYKDVEIYARVGAELAAVRDYIDRKLQETFSNHNEDHFVVELNFGGSGSYNLVVTSDEVGTFIYYGTSAHSISSDGPMPLWGGTAFARSVMHPGQESKKEEIDDIVAEAFEIMWSAGEGGTLWAS